MLLLFCSGLVATAQTSAPQSQDTAPARSQTTSIESSALQTLRPLVEQALTSSEDSDQTLLDLNQQIERDRQQKIADDEQRKKEAEQRQKEQTDSAAAFKTLSARAGRLQTFSDNVLSRLTDFSGSEEEKQAAALAVVDAILAGAKKVEGENKVLKWACGILAAIAIRAGIYAIAK
ncbi:MAG: hypothetical protein IMZ69_08380 [Spirochaetes bacterium]|nr:hypothetical protein [Spirochaetota bacterium]